MLLENKISLDVPGRMENAIAPESAAETMAATELDVSGPGTSTELTDTFVTGVGAKVSLFVDTPPVGSSPDVLPQSVRVQVADENNFWRGAPQIFAYAALTTARKGNADPAAHLPFDSAVSFQLDSANVKPALPFNRGADGVYRATLSTAVRRTTGPKEGLSTTERPDHLELAFHSDLFGGIYDSNKNGDINKENYTGSLRTDVAPLPPVPAIPVTEGKFAPIVPVTVGGVSRLGVVLAPETRAIDGTVITPTPGHQVQVAMADTAHEHPNLQAVDPLGANSADNKYQPGKIIFNDLYVRGKAHPNPGSLIVWRLDDDGIRTDFNHAATALVYDAKAKELAQSNPALAEKCRLFAQLVLEIHELTDEKWKRDAHIHLAETIRRADSSGAIYSALGITAAGLDANGLPTGDAGLLFGIGVRIPVTDQNRTLEAFASSVHAGYLQLKTQQDLIAQVTLASAKPASTERDAQIEAIVKELSAHT